MEEYQSNPAAVTEPAKLPESKRIMAGVCALLLGSFGVHKFVLGYTSAGVIQLIITLVGAPIFVFFTCGIGVFLTPLLWIIPAIEGIIYFTKSDEDFIKIYQVNKRQWF